MKMSILFSIAIAPLMMIAAGASSPVSTAMAQDQELPGICNGRTDANVVVKAQANGHRGDTPKYLLNISADGVGDVSGIMILGQGRDRLKVTDWCRLWQHIPGDPYGECDDDQPKGSTDVHAVGLGALRDGQKVLVRTDVRENDEGVWFRVRYRSMDDHGAGDDCTNGDEACGESGNAGGHDADACEDEAWTAIPSEGWLPLKQLRVSAGGSS